VMCLSFDLLAKNWHIWLLPAFVSERWHCLRFCMFLS